MAVCVKDLYIFQNKPRYKKMVIIGLVKGCLAAQTHQACAGRHISSLTGVLEE